MISGVYKIENKINGRLYIGSTNNFKHRWAGHKSTLKRGVHKNYVLQQAFDKYGEENLEFIRMVECLPEERLELEQLIIDEMDWKKLYNLSKEVSKPTPMTDEIKAKISKTKSIPIEAFKYPSMEFVGSYDSAFKCSKELNIQASNINAVLNKRDGRKQTGGYCFKRINQC